jgi:hypothetical protein
MWIESALDRAIPTRCGGDALAWSTHIENRGILADGDGLVDVRNSVKKGAR